jgi:deferrochelatase/peroxidase EfeB
VFGGAAALGLGAGLERALGRATSASSSASAASSQSAGAIPFYGRHQAGIATPAQAHLQFAAFDLTTDSARGLREVLSRWSAAAADLTAGRPYTGEVPSGAGTPTDPGEALGLGPSQLTLTFGVGPGPFDRASVGLRQRPGQLHVLTRLVAGVAKLRWTQSGFLPRFGAGQTPRNLMGFKDGTHNIRGDDEAALARFVWVGGEGPRWMRGGSFLVVRRIDIAFDSWDASTLALQQSTFGRQKVSGAPLSGAREHDPVNLSAVDSSGALVIPADAHIRVASEEANHGTRILRRGYFYAPDASAKAVDHGGRQLQGGLFFIAFVRDPGRFIAMQRRLSTADALNAFTVHTASAIFAVPPGAAPGGFVGDGLLS